MGVIKEQSIVNTVVIYIGIVLGFISTIYLYPNILTPDQYGLTRLMLSIAFIGTQFAHLGMKNIAIKYFPYFEDKELKHNGFLFFTLIVPLLGFLLFLLVLFLGNDLIIDYYKDSSALFTDYYWYLIPLVLGVLYFDVINSYVRALQDSIPGSVISDIILRIISIILLLLFFYEWITFKHFILGFVLSYLLQPFLLLVHLYNQNELFLKPNFGILNTTLIKRIGNYGFYVLLGGMATLIVNNIDIIMLGSLSGLTNTGIYAIAFYIGNVIIVPQRAIGKIAPSLISENLKENNLREVEKIYKSASLNQLVAGFFIFTGIWGNLENLMEILPEEYASAAWIIIIIGLAKLFDMAAGNNGAIILNSKYYRFNLYAIGFLVFISIGLNYWLIPILGIMGAAIATAISIFLYNILKGVFIWFKFRMQPLTPKILIVILLSILLLLISVQIDRIGNLYVDILIRSLAITIIYSSGIILFNVSEEANKIWDDIKSKFP